MPRVEVVVVTMAGNEYLLFDQGAGASFPEGELAEGEAPADAARRLVREATGSDLPPKLELVDLPLAAGALRLVFRALVPDAPSREGVTRAPRMGLPEKVGSLEGRYVDEALKTSLSYKLTRG